ncbi:hypothetical protein ABH899_004915 [Paenibacillus sp. RC84]
MEGDGRHCLNAAQNTSIAYIKPKSSNLGGFFIYCGDGIGRRTFAMVNSTLMGLRV